MSCLNALVFIATFMFTVWIYFSLVHLAVTTCKKIGGNHAVDKKRDVYGVSTITPPADAFSAVLDREQGTTAEGAPVMAFTDTRSDTSLGATGSAIVNKFTTPSLISGNDNNANNDDEGGYRGRSVGKLQTCPVTEKPSTARAKPRKGNKVAKRNNYKANDNNPVRQRVVRKTDDENGCTGNNNGVKEREPMPQSPANGGHDNKRTKRSKGRISANHVEKEAIPKLPYEHVLGVNFVAVEKSSTERPNGNASSSGEEVPMDTTTAISTDQEDAVRDATTVSSDKLDIVAEISSMYNFCSVSFIIKSVLACFGLGWLLLHGYTPTKLLNAARRRIMQSHFGDPTEMSWPATRQTFDGRTISESHALNLDSDDSVAETVLASELARLLTAPDSIPDSTVGSAYPSPGSGELPASLEATVITGSSSSRRLTGAPLSWFPRTPQSNRSNWRMDEQQAQGRQIGQSSPSGGLFQ